MQGATDIRLNVTMDASQARAESERLHRELERRYRAPSADDAPRRAWDRVTGMPENPFNPDLPYEHARHTGIWWARHGGHQALGNQEYRHQWFTEREARYMGLQFARSASKELIGGLKTFAVTVGSAIFRDQVSYHVDKNIMPGQYNRGHIRTKNIAESSMNTGLTWGAMGVGLVSLLKMIPHPVTQGLGWGATLLGAGAAAAAGAGYGAYTGSRDSDLQFKRMDAQHRLDERMFEERLRIGKNQSVADLAFSKILSMTPSREGKLAAIDRQKDALLTKGDLGILHLNKEYKRLLKEGKLETGYGELVKQMRMERKQQFTNLQIQRYAASIQPTATPIDSITDSYSRRGLFVGGNVDTISVNREIISIISKILQTLEKKSTMPINISDYFEAKYQ